jgi:hypothetical protein
MLLSPTATLIQGGTFAMPISRKHDKYSEHDDFEA